MRATVTVWTLICTSLLLGCGSRDEPSAPSLTRLLEDRPAPDLARLRERSAPGLTGDDVTEAFHDILRLRTLGDGAAVPVLGGIVADHAGLGRTHGFAAQQALFCIDTPEAHGILAKHLLAPKHMAAQGIRYTFHWEMPEPQRSAFIDRYHLVTLSDDLGLTLTATERDGAERQAFDLTLTVRNTSARPLEIREGERLYGGLLHVQSAAGRFARTYETPTSIEFSAPVPRWITLAPGEEVHWLGEMTVIDAEQFDRSKPIYRRLPRDAGMMLRANSVLHDIPGPGRYTIRAMFETKPLTPPQAAHYKLDYPWGGRVVSNPVTIEIN